MTEKELRKLNRTELLEMLIAQSKKLSRVEEELSAAQKELERRKIAITTSGSLAEAALKLNGIFEAADQAAAQYLDSLREQESNAEHIIAEAEAKAHEIINAAEVQRQAILADAGREAKRSMADGWALVSNEVELHSALSSSEGNINIKLAPLDFIAHFFQLTQKGIKVGGRLFHDDVNILVNLVSVGSALLIDCSCV